MTTFRNICGGLFVVLALWTSKKNSARSWNTVTM
jgi:hypothetical protein